MSPIRILVAGLVALDRDIVERIAGERGDMTIVSRADVPARADATLDVSGVDVLLAAASDPDALSAYLALVRSHPRLGVVVVDPADRLCVLRRCRPFEQVRGADSPWPRYLVDAIRAAAADGGRR
jgi:hypothetical protein